jgi:hypothetical protein
MTAFKLRALKNLPEYFVADGTCVEEIDYPGQRHCVIAIHPEFTPMVWFGDCWRDLFPQLET